VNRPGAGWHKPKQGDLPTTKQGWQNDENEQKPARQVADGRAAVIGSSRVFPRRCALAFHG
jgi:hypothetical protein